MVGMAGFSMSEATIRNQIASAIDVIVQVQRFPDGKRRITSVAELTGIEDMTIQMQEIFRFKQTAVLDDGRIDGSHEATGLRPAFIEHIRLNGGRVDDRLFVPGV